MNCKNCNYKPKFCPECGIENANDLPEYRMIIHGLPSSGVSSTANTIFGEKRFETQMSFDSTTKTCQLETCERFGSLLKIVDTPGFVVEETGSCSTNRFNGINKAIDLLKPGPHVLIIVFSLDVFNEESRIFIRNLKCLESISKYGIVVFTKADMAGKNVTETNRKIEKSKELGELLNLSNHRFLLFNNSNCDQNQVEDLLNLVRKMAKDNNNQYFDNAIFGHDIGVKFTSVDKETTSNQYMKSGSSGSLLF